jgi:hypothetical protein
MLPSFQYYVNLFFEAAARLPSPEYLPAERKLPPGGPHNLPRYSTCQSQRTGVKMTPEMRILTARKDVNQCLWNFN